MLVLLEVELLLVLVVELVLVNADALWDPCRFGLAFFYRFGRELQKDLQPSMFTKWRTALHRQQVLSPALQLLVPAKTSVYVTAAADVVVTAASVVASFVVTSAVVAAAVVAVVEVVGIVAVVGVVDSSVVVGDPFEYNVASERLDRFMGDHIIPLTAETNAVIIEDMGCRGFATFRNCGSKPAFRGNVGS